MRRQLILGAAAITTTIVIAFVVPLGLAVRVLAANRPVNAAEQTAQSVATVFALTDDQQVTADAVTAAQARSSAALTVYLRDGRILGTQQPPGDEVNRAFQGVSFAAEIDDDQHIFVPAIRGDGTAAVVRAVVPAAVLRDGVLQSWLLLAALGLGMILVAAAIADWLGRSVVRPARALATTARRIADGDVEARVAPSGPPEIADVGGALNSLAGRITTLLAAERELVADLSHRLRTPLTALRLDAEAIIDETERERLRNDVDAVEATVSELIREAREPASTPGEPIDLVPIVRERSAYWGALADEQARRWTLEITTAFAPALVRPADAEALLDVLLDNVFTHTPEGTGYAVRLEPGRLVVEDEGEGFTAAPTASNRGRSGGGSTGLGLDIARQTAERTGGRLHVVPRTPRGTRVEVTLPPPQGAN